MQPVNHSLPVAPVPAAPDGGYLLAQIGMRVSYADALVAPAPEPELPAPTAPTTEPERDILGDIKMAVEAPDADAPAAPPPPAVEAPPGIDGEFAGEYNPAMDPVYGLTPPTEQERSIFDPGTFRSRHAVEKAMRNMKTALSVPRSVEELTKMVEAGMLGSSTADPYQDNLRSVIRAMVRGL